MIASSETVWFVYSFQNFMSLNEHNRFENNTVIFNSNGCKIKPQNGDIKKFKIKKSVKQWNLLSVKLFKLAVECT